MKKNGLNIEVNTEYIYAAQNYIINFTEYGKIVVKQNGKIVDNIDATDSKNIDNEKLKFPFIIDGKSYNTTISMNENEIDVDAYIEGLGTVTYIKKTSSNECTTYGTAETYILINNNTNKAYYVFEGQIVFEKMDVTTGTVTGYNNGKYADYIMDSHVRNATKIISDSTSLKAVIAQNGNVYMLGFQITSQGSKEIVDTEFVLNNSIDYSSILEQIQ